MSSTVSLGQVAVHCPRCRNSQLEYDNAKVRGVGTEMRCPRCGQGFRAEAGIDSREVERRAVKHVEKEIQKAFKGLKGFNINL